MLEYSKLIKEYRERKFLTQKALAKELGVNYVTISRWETGAFEPNMAMKKKAYRSIQGSRHENRMNGGYKHG